MLEGDIYTNNSLNHSSYQISFEDGLLPYQTIYNYHSLHWSNGDRLGQLFEEEKGNDIKQPSKAKHDEQVQLVA